MQREKFYNLQRTVRIIYTAFVIKKKQNSEWTIFEAAKILHERGLPFFVFHLFITQYFFFKKTEYEERCSVKSSTICKQQFILIVSFFFSKKSKILWTIFRNDRKLVAQNTVYFETKNTK